MTKPQHTANYKNRMKNVNLQKTLPAYWGSFDPSQDLYGPEPVDEMGFPGPYHPPSPMDSPASPEESPAPSPPPYERYGAWLRGAVADASSSSTVPNDSVPSAAVDDNAQMEITPAERPPTPIPEGGCSQPSPTQSSLDSVPELSDEVDGWFSSLLVKTVKTALLHLFNLNYIKYVRENCYGCQISHPSQRQHECLSDMNEDYLQVHFEGISKRMITPKFIPAIQNLLHRKNIQATDGKVTTVVKTLMHELKYGFKLHSSIVELYENVSQGQQLAELNDVSKCFGFAD